MADLTVVGAGVSGLTMARLAADHGATVLIHESRSHIGGNAWSFADEETGVEIHPYGTHVFHNSSRRVQRFFDRFGRLNGYRHFVTAVARGGRYPVPINLDTIRLLAGSPMMPPASAREWVASQAGDPSSLSGVEAVAVATAGRTAYEFLVAGYTA